MKNKQNLLNKETTQKQNRIWVRISSACNNSCIFCLDIHAHEGTFVDYESVRKQIEEWYKKWYENRIILSWGEASINPEFPEYIQYAKKVWYDRVQTVTNGNMFVSEQFCKNVFKSWLEEVTFSFHWHNAILHDYLVNTKWAFKKSLKWLIYVKKYFPHIIVNIDIVVNKINVKYLPDIVTFFRRLGVEEYDILQIIPFGKGFSQHKDQLFYNVWDYSKELKRTWELWKKPWMNMWTNRFPAEAFEWYEDLIQDPRKIRSEVWWEAEQMFTKFISSKWINKPKCFWEACNVCFLRQYCHGFLEKIEEKKLAINENYFILKGEEFPSTIYNKYGESSESFQKFLSDKLSQKKKLINVPKCLWGEWVYEFYNDSNPTYELKHYTDTYIKNLYKKKSLRCTGCKYNDECEGIWINFIRSYWFKILQPVK